jgi:hypothetical protein
LRISINCSLTNHKIWKVNHWKWIELLYCWLHDRYDVLFLRLILKSDFRTFLSLVDYEYKKNYLLVMIGKSNKIFYPTNISSKTLFRRIDVLQEFNSWFSAIITIRGNFWQNHSLFFYFLFFDSNLWLQWLK